MSIEQFLKKYKYTYANSKDTTLHWFMYKSVIYENYVYLISMKNPKFVQFNLLLIKIKHKTW